MSFNKIPFRDSNPGFLRLKELEPITVKGFVKDLFTKPQIKNYVDTVKYVFNRTQNNESIDAISRRTLGSMVAEIHTANWVEGVQHGVNMEDIDSTDPWQFDYDVLSAPKYSSLRIEVKTTKGPTVSVSTKWDGPYQGSGSLNIRGIMSGVPDLYLIYYIDNNSTKDFIDLTLTPMLLCARDCLDPGTKMVVKEHGFGYVLNTADKKSILCESPYHFY